MAPGFWPAARRKRGRISKICNPFCNAADGQKNKPDGAAMPKHGKHPSACPASPASSPWRACIWAWPHPQADATGEGATVTRRKKVLTTRYSAVIARPRERAWRSSNPLPMLPPLDCFASLAVRWRVKTYDRQYESSPRSAPVFRRRAANVSRGTWCQAGQRTPGAGRSKGRRFNARLLSQSRGNVGDLCTAVQFARKSRMPSPHFDVDTI